MKLYMVTTNPANLRVTVRVLTEDGKSIAQAVDSKHRTAAAERRAIAQACRYARDHGWTDLVFRPSREIK